MKGFECLQIVMECMVKKFTHSFFNGVMQEKLAYVDGERDAVLLHHEFIIEGLHLHD